MPFAIASSSLCRNASLALVDRTSILFAEQKFGRIRRKVTPGSTICRRLRCFWVAVTFPACRAKHKEDLNEWGNRATLMSHSLKFRFAAAADFPAVLELASQLASQIEAEDPPLTIAQFETYYVSPHAPTRLLLA